LAKVLEGYSGLHKDYDRFMNKAKVAIFAAIVSFLLIDWKGFFFFIMAICIAFAMHQISKAKNFKIGVQGERTMKRICRKLPDAYSVVTNVELHVDGRAIHYDAIIVGPAGIFVVEAKNMNGTIIGSGTSLELVQHKIGRRGGRYSNRVRNPIRQLDGQIFQLSNLLKQHQLGVWIKGIVFFTNKEAEVKITNANVPVFSTSQKGAKLLKKMLLEIEANQQHVSQQAQDKAIAVLTGQTP